MSPEVPDDVLPMDASSPRRCCASRHRRVRGPARGGGPTPLACTRPSGSGIRCATSTGSGLAAPRGAVPARGRLEPPALHVSGWYDRPSPGRHAAQLPPHAAGVKVPEGQWSYRTWTHINRTGDGGPGLAAGEAGRRGAVDVLQLDFWRASLGDAAAAARLPAGRARVCPGPRTAGSTCPIGSYWTRADARRRHCRRRRRRVRRRSRGRRGEASTGFVHDPADPVPTCSA